MANLHGLILVPYYVFASVGILLVLVLLTRLTRIRAGLNALVLASIFVGLVSVAAPFILGYGCLADFTLVRMLALLGGTILLAYVDTALTGWLPIPLDRELEEL